MTETVDYDVIIIGAGIQGAGVAQACIANGYKTLVIEKFSDAGMGTSSKSSKLIHGGLRYLEHGQIGLVRECLNERKYLLRNAPELVKLLPFYIPVYSDSSRPAWLIWLGLIIYSLLSFKPFKIIPASRWHQLDGLNQENLKYVFSYLDAKTSDVKLTRAVISSASNMGADILYSTEFIESSYSGNRHIASYRNQQGKILTASCHCIINCSGPWVESVQKKISPQLELPAIDLVAGTHIIVNTPTTQGAFYLQASDGRAIFVIPWDNDSSLIGTTERLFKGQTEELEASDSEINYLLNTYNQYFKNRISHENIIDVFCGLRVLPAANEHSFKRSRDSLILQHDETPTLITLIGGKLTAYRASSENVLKRVRKACPNSAPRLDTKNIKLRA